MESENKRRKIEESSASYTKDEKLTEKWNIQISKSPTLNFPEVLKVTDQRQVSERTMMVRSILEKITFDAPEMTSLYEDKQSLHNLISSVRSMKTILNSIKHQNTELSILQKDVILSTEKFLTKVTLLLLSIFRTDDIHMNVYLDLFISFLDICGILTWPGEVYQRKSLILGEVHSGSPDLYLLSRNIDDNFMNTVGTVTYSRQEIVIEGDVPEDFGKCECSKIQEGRSQFTKSTENNASLPAQISRDTCKTPQYENKKTNVTTSEQLSTSTSRHDDADIRTPKTFENFERIANLSYPPSRPVFVPRKRTFEGRIKQPAVKLSPENAMINKIPIIITLAPDSENHDEEIRPGQSPNPSGLRQCTFQTPGRKLNIPTRLIAGVKSAIEHEFPSTKLQTPMPNLSNVPLPIIVTTAEATEAKLKQNANPQKETGDENRSCKSNRERENSDSVTNIDSKHSSDIGKSVLTSEVLTNTTEILTSKIDDPRENETYLPPATDFPIPGTSGIQQIKLPITCQQVQNDTLSTSQMDTNSDRLRVQNASSHLTTENSDTPQKCESVRNSAGNNHNTSSKPVSNATSCQCNQCAKQMGTGRTIPSEEQQLSLTSDQSVATFCNGMGLEKGQFNLEKLSSKQNILSTNKPQMQIQLNFGNIELDNPSFQVKSSVRCCTEGLPISDTCKERGRQGDEYMKNKPQKSIEYLKMQKSRALNRTADLKNKRNRPTHERKTKTKRKRKDQINSDSGLDNCSRTHSDMLSFHGKLGSVCPSVHNFPQSFIEEDDGRCRNNATMPVFTINSQNSMYALKINSEFQCLTHDEEPRNSLLQENGDENRNTFHNGQQEYVQSILQENEVENRNSCNNGEGEYVQLGSIDWLLEQQLQCPDTSDIELTDLDIFEKSLSFPELSNSIQSVEKDLMKDKHFFNKNFNALLNFESNLSDDLIRNLLLEWPHSKTKPISTGFILHKTKVIIASLEMSHHHFEYLIGDGKKSPDDSPIIKYTRVLDILKHSDRQMLACIASQLCHMKD